MNLTKREQELYLQMVHPVPTMHDRLDRIEKAGGPTEYLEDPDVGGFDAVIEAIDFSANRKRNNSMAEQRIKDDGEVAELLIKLGYKHSIPSLATLYDHKLYIECKHGISITGPYSDGSYAQEPWEALKNLFKTFS